MLHDLDVTLVLQNSAASAAASLKPKELDIVLCGAQQNSAASAAASLKPGTSVRGPRGARTKFRGICRGLIEA